ncbi:MAG: transposase [Saprospirales bacterium]|nr:transposase [Saprospirales bacterium]
MFFTPPACLNPEWFESIPRLNEQLQEWWQIYNTIRPHSSIDYLTPDEFEKLNENLYFKTVAA